MGHWRYFVVLAGMRTGSNLLEELLESVPGITTHGELFNPHFFGKPKAAEQFGMSMPERDNDPVSVISAMVDRAEGLPGFRLFQDHNPRILDYALKDPSCAKIILKRRLIDSFVSLEIARKTGQWWLGDVKSARDAKVAFEPEDYAAFADDTSAFYRDVENRLQNQGQVAFRLSYPDLASPDVISGLVRFLGLSSEPDPALVRARVQNPVSVEERLTNPEIARQTLAAEAADIGDPPVHEPGRGPGVRFFRAANELPLLYMPVRGAGPDPIPEWLSAVADGDLLPPFTQRDLRRWKRQNPGHQSFTVLRHPLPRAYDVFCRNIVSTELANFADVREALVRRYDVPLPAATPGADWTLRDHQSAFLAFLVFLKANLSGQTSVKVDTSWATQEKLLTAIAGLVVPDRVLREEHLGEALFDLAKSVGAAPPHKTLSFSAPESFKLEDVVTDDIQEAAEAAYRRDYMMFGFARWRPQAA